MDSIRAKLGAWSKDKALMRIFLAAGAVLIILVILCCISIHMRSNIQQRYSNAIYQTQEEAYQHLIALTESFSALNDSEAPDSQSAISEFKAQYTAVNALNSVLIASYGENNAVLNAELSSALSTAFGEYMDALNQGRPTGLAKADIQVCIESFEQMIEARYAHLEEEPVIVIDGSSGEIRKNK